MTKADATDRRKCETRAWFERLQEEVIAAFELLEKEAEGPFAEPVMAPGRFLTKPWARTDHAGGDGGGGRMAILAGRVFEKMAVHISTVFGTFLPEFAAQNTWRRNRFGVLGLRGFTDRASLESKRSHRPYEYAFRRDHQGVVRRRRRSHSRARPKARPNRSGHPRLPCRHEGRLRQPRQSCGSREVQAMVRRLFLSEAPQRAARDRGDFLRLSRLL